MIRGLIKMVDNGVGHNLYMGDYIFSYVLCYQYVRGNVLVVAFY
jgi:hypothetical protein